MSLTKTINYEIEKTIPNIGKLTGKIKIFENPILDVNTTKYPINLSAQGTMIKSLELKYDPKLGLDFFEGRLKGDFLLPDNIPLTDGGGDFKKSKEYDSCIDAIYNILEEISDKEWLTFNPVRFLDS